MYFLHVLSPPLPPHAPFLAFTQFYVTQCYKLYIVPQPCSRATSSASTGTKHDSTSTCKQNMYLSHSQHGSSFLYKQTEAGNHKTCCFRKLKQSSGQPCCSLWSERHSNQRIALQDRIHSWQGSKCWGLVLRRQMPFFPPTSGSQQRAPNYRPDTLLPMWAPSVINDSCAGRRKKFPKEVRKGKRLRSHV